MFVSVSDVPMYIDSRFPSANLYPPPILYKSQLLSGLNNGFPMSWLEVPVQ